MSEVNVEDLSYEIELLLKAVLIYAGAKREKLEKLCDIYIENIDKILENSNSQGVDEIIEVVEYLKKNYKEYFKN